MSRRAASSAGTVSLFPFLAVLVCAMGALILLLLVTTRRIRQRSLAEEVLVVPADDEPSAEPTLPERAASLPPPIMAENKPDLDEVPLLPLLADDPPKPLPKPFDPTPALLKKLAALEARQASLAADVAARREQIAELESKVVEKRQTLTDLASTTTALNTEKDRLNDLYFRLRQQQDETQQRADELRQRIQHAQAQAADADSRFAFVTYDGQSGTTRRPIIIECTADRLTFVSEGISLRATDLDGFYPRLNPLLSATQSLNRYWEHRRRTSLSGDVGKPYVLLVVRPGGTTAYYVAQGLLSDLTEPFGYELVTEDQKFAWPPSEPAAVKSCQSVVNRMLLEHDELMKHSLHGGAYLPRYSDEQGNFRLPEVDRLRNPTREVTINGQHFSREPPGGGRRRGWPEEYGAGEASSVPPGERLNAYGRGDAPDGQDAFDGQQDAASGGIDIGDDPSMLVIGDGTATDEETGAGNSGLGEEGTGFGPRPGPRTAPPEQMPDWMQDGAVRLAPTSPGGGSEGHSEMSRIDPFAEVDDLEHMSPRERGISSGRTNGQSGTYDATATKTGTPADSHAQPNPDMITLTPQGKRREPTVDPVRPQWGIRTAGGTIGYERDVRVDVSATQVSVGEHNGFLLDRSMPITDVRRLLAAAIDREVRRWGPPPKSFYWVPSIRFVVAPDGRAAYDRLRSIVQSWELRSTMEQTAE